MSFPTHNLAIYLVFLTSIPTINLFLKSCNPKFIFVIWIFYFTGLATPIPQEAEIIPDEPIEPVEPADTIEPIVEDTAVEAETNELIEPAEVIEPVAPTETIEPVEEPAKTIEPIVEDNSQQQPQSSALSGGNTIQIPTIFFLILAIFNH